MFFVITFPCTRIILKMLLLETWYGFYCTLSVFRTSSVKMSRRMIDRLPDRPDHYILEYLFLPRMLHINQIIQFLLDIPVSQAFYILIISLKQFSFLLSLHYSCRCFRVQHSDDTSKLEGSPALPDQALLCGLHLNK